MSSTTSIDDVHRLPQNGIRVIVVGGGIAGFMSALECWRKGCEVEVLERNESTSPLGDFFALSPSAWSTLHHYPSMLADYHRTVYKAAVQLQHPKGHTLIKVEPEWDVKENDAEAKEVRHSMMNRRPVVVSMLLEQCLRLGIPIHYGQKVVDGGESEEDVVIKTEKGDEFKGDIAIVCDGVGSKSHRLITHDDSGLVDSGYAVARTAYPAEIVKSGSPAESLVPKYGERPQFRLYTADDMHIVVVLTHDWIGWQHTHRNDGTAEESWRHLREPQELIDLLEKCAPEWDPAFIDLLRQTPQKVVDWNLTFRDGKEKWTSDGGRVLQLGDCAHSTLPTSGQGATQALEDAITIGECLHQAGKENARLGAMVCNKLRFQRTNTIQRMGFVNREEWHHADLDAIAKDPSLMEPLHFRWIWNHQPEKYAADNYAACVAHLVEGKPFENTNLPVGHVWEPWNMESEMKRQEAGIPSNLRKNGDWSL